MAIREIGLSRKQRVFAVLEDTTGTLKFPAAGDYIRPAGNAVANQNPAFVDSEELQDSLDVLDRFQDAMPAASWTIPMYVRPAGFNNAIGLMKAPQGDALFVSMQGEVATPNAELETAIATTGAACYVPIRAASIVGDFPETGVIKLGTELLYYISKTGGGMTVEAAGRGYAGTTGATHATGAAGATAGDAGYISLASRFYKQTTDCPSLSVWIETDHFLQAISGATVNSGKLSVTNVGAVKLECSGEGMRMYYAGTSTLSTGATAGDTTLTLSVDSVTSVKEATFYSVGSYIWNETQAISTGTGATGDYLIITGVDTTANTITVGTQLGVDFDYEDVIKGYLPTATAIGTPIESRYTAVLINGIGGVFKSGELTINVPKQYITDEIGILYPRGYLENVRDITSSMGLYFRRSDARYFSEGYDATNFSTVKLTFGVNEITPAAAHGQLFEVYMKRCKLEVPTINFAAPAVELTVPLKALGTLGEDSLEVYFR